MTFLKILALILFGLLTLGSGVCTLLFLPSMGEMYIGYAPLFIGLPIALVSGGISYLLWRNLRRAKTAAAARDDA